MKMEIPKKEMTLAFNPFKSNDMVKDIFSNYYARVLWCCIKSQHITNQYFNEKVLNFAEYLTKELEKSSADGKPFTYWKFEKIVTWEFPRMGIRSWKSKEWPFQDYLRPDKRYWFTIYKYLLKNPAFVISYPEDENGTTREL